jgi:hypothetical protein
MTPEQKQKWLDKITTHGAYKDYKEAPEHYVWRAMIYRCTKPSCRWYKYYGAKGITVCDAWLDYQAFINDMGVRPSKDYSLDRIDNTKGYSLNNCRWATRSEQQKNKSTTKQYTDGVFVGTLIECATHIGISKELAHYRFNKWGSFEKDKEWHLLPRNG